MKSKLNYLIGLSLKRKIGTKTFKIVNILLAILIIALANIDSIIKAFGGDFDKKQVINIIDNTNYSYDLFKAQMLNITSSSNEEDMKYEIKLYTDTEETINTYLEDKEHTNEYFIVINPDVDNTLTAKVISNNQMDIYDYSYIETSLNNSKINIAMSLSGIDPNKLADIYKPVEYERVILKEGEATTGEKMDAIMSTVFPVIILPFFILVVYLTQMVGAEINDEKSTKGMEVIISSVPPTTHFFSKIVAGNLFVLGQGLLLFIYGFVGFKLRNVFGGNNITGGVMSSVSGMLNEVMDTTFVSKLIYIIPLTIILMLLSCLAYSLLAGILASMTTNNEDYQQMQSPIMIVLMVGYYLAILSGTFKGAIFIKILSYIPFISAILAPSLLVIGEIGIIDIIIAILLNIGMIYLLIKYGLRIYKVGILNYSSSGLWKKMAKAIKKR